MKISVISFVGCLLMFCFGCSTPHFQKYASQPSEMIGFGVDQSWMYIDMNKFGDEMVKAGVNTTSIGLFGCNKDKTETQTLPWGYYMDHFDEMKPTLTKFLDAMKKRRITVYVTITGWNHRNGNPDINTGKPSTICSGQYSLEWFNHILDYFIERGTDGIVLCTAGEPVPNYGDGGPCISKFYQFSNLLDTRWTGMKGWNLGVRPTSAPPGYFIEYHPQKSNERTPAGCIVLTDGPAASEFGNSDPVNPSIENGPALQAFIKKINSEGKGFIWWGMSFNGKVVDYNGIKIIGEAVK